MTKIIHRFMKLPYPKAIGGDGPYILGEDGKRYIDAASGAGVSCLGYSDKAISDAICKQSHDLAYVYNAYFTTEPAEQLAESLIDLSPNGLDWVFFGSGGSESMDGALKMALQYFVDKDEPQRHRFIARKQSYHGCTVGALSISGNLARRSLYEEFLPETHHISPCYEYRDRLNHETPEQYGLRVAKELEDKIIELGPDSVAAFIAEPVVGATGGCIPPVKGYFKEIRRICDKYGVLLILDEILTGAGRTGTYLSCEQDDIVPDLATLAKGLGAGYQPISAILVSDKIYRTLADNRGFFIHGHTYNAHATACAAALAVNNAIRERSLLPQVKDMGDKLKSALHEKFANHPHVGDIRGRGLLIGMELVADRTTKEPFPADRLLWLGITRVAMENGLVCYPGAGTVDGTRGDHILLAPPFIINENHIEEIVDKLSRSIDTALKLGPPTLP